MKNFAIVLSTLLFCACTSFETLRKDKFESDYATKSPAIFLVSKPVNGKFVRVSLAKDTPLMSLKRGFGYSVYQLYDGRIGEVANEMARPKEAGETFEAFYSKLKQRNDFFSRSDFPAVVSNPDIGYRQKRGYGSMSPSSKDGDEETFPILNNSLESVEPDLPTW